MGIHSESQEIGVGIGTRVKVAEVGNQSQVFWATGVRIPESVHPCPAQITTQAKPRTRRTGMPIARSNGYVWGITNMPVQGPLKSWCAPSQIL